MTKLSTADDPPVEDARFWWTEFGLAPSSLLDKYKEPDRAASDILSAVVKKAKEKKKKKNQTGHALNSDAIALEKVAMIDTCVGRDPPAFDNCIIES